MDSLKQQAFEVATHVVEQFPNSPDAICLMGLVHHRYGASDQAVAYWQQCLALDPGCADAHFCLGRHALERGDYPEAAKRMRAALAIDPRTPDVRLLLADTLTGMGKMGEAIAVLEEHLASSPESVQGLFRLGQAYLHSKQYEKAKAFHEKAVKLDPDHKHAYYGLATACARLGEKEKSAEYRKKFEAIHADQRPPAKGRRLDYDDLATMRRSLVDTHLGAARVYAAHGDQKQAERHRQIAAALDAKDAGTRENE